MREEKGRKYKYDIHGLLRVISDFPGYLPEFFSVPELRDEPDIIIRLGERISPKKEKDYYQIAPGLYCGDSERSVISQFKFYGLSFSWKLKGLTEKKTEVFVSKAYMKLVRMPVSTVFPLNDYIKFILQIRLIQEGYSFLSGGCLRPAGKDFGLIISSSGGMGKTSAVLNLLRKEGGEFYSDDSIIVSKDRVFAYPAPLRIRKFGSPVLSYNKDTPFEEIMPGTAVASNPVCPRYIFFLERSDKDGLIKVDSDSAFNRIIAINRKTIPYLVERSILAYFYSSYSTGLYDVLEKERSIFKQLLHNVICYAVRVPHPDRYVQMISEIIKKGT